MLLVLFLIKCFSVLTVTLNKYVVKHKSAKLFMTYAVGKLEAALISQYKPFNIKYKQSES